MNMIKKKIVTDEDSRPVAVLVDYADWLEIEKALHLSPSEEKTVDMASFTGVIQLTEDPSAFQARMREEWR